jgi:integrase
MLRRVLKPAAASAGVGSWTKMRSGKPKAESWVAFHAFRHTCATMLFRHGWNAVKVQKHLGHADPGFTLRRYVHLLDDDMDAPDFMDAKTRQVGNRWATRPAETGRDERVAASVG